MKLSLLTIVFMLWTGLARAQDIKCQINEFGWVRLMFVHKIDANREQTMSYSMGKEDDWENPYKARTLCEELRKEILSPVGEAWGSEECYGDGTAEYKFIGYSITEAGAQLLGGESKKIWFAPHLYFPLKRWTQNDSKVDESFIRIVKIFDRDCSYPAR